MNNLVGPGQRTIVFAASVILSLLLSVASVGCDKPNGGLSFGGGARYIYIEPEVDISPQRPKLYEPFIVTGKATALRQDLADAELWLNVSGAVYLEGEDRWHGPLKKGENKTISAVFAFVTEGNHEVAASSVGNAGPNLVQPGLRSRSINLYVSESYSTQNVEIGPAGRAYSWGSGDPHVVPGGRLILADTALLLNRGSSTRIEIVNTKEDLSRLQSEGLIPEELKYEWRFINPDTTVDFSKQFFVAYFDVPRPAPGHLLLMEDQGPGTLVWDVGILKGNLQTHAIPMEENQSDRLVSSVSVYQFGRNFAPGGLPDTRAFQGSRTFEFAIDGAGPVRVNKDLQ